MREMELYVHIPFCVRKCPYCDFLSAAADSSTRSSYVQRLLEEIRRVSPDYAEYEVGSVYIGGGTPSLLDPFYIERLMDTLFKNFHIRDGAEITMECNPGTVEGGKARIMYGAGINRLSFGLQSVHNVELERLGRIHTYEDFLMSYGEAKKAGFRNINVDLMFGLPLQGTSEWKDTLKKAVMMRPEHISAYSLIIEKGTPFYARYHTDEVAREQGKRPIILPTEEEERSMYEMTSEYLGSHGYRRYEISNYAREGYECRHNIGYWTGEEYLGLGLGASSLIGDTRFKNTEDFADYMTKPFARTEVIVLDRNARIEEFMFLGLRMADGISRTEFAERFGCEPEAVYGDTLFRLQEEGLLAAEEGMIFLTPRGVDVSNTVFAQLLL